MAEDFGKDQYDGGAEQYDELEKLPHSILSQQLVLAALGDCTGQVILDLGGGSGLHARNAVEKGAERVDNVDISRELLKRCEDAERRAGRKMGDRVACYIADATQPLDALELPGRRGSGSLYDVVMVNWTFDHAENIVELEQMRRNTGRYCRPGVKVISIRLTDPLIPSSSSGKYGVTIHDMKEIPGGAHYTYTVHGDKPFSAQAKPLWAHWDPENAKKMAKDVGFMDLVAVPVAHMSIVKENEGFWEDFVKAQSFRCVVGTKSEV